MESKNELEKRYQEYKDRNLNLNMERGWPCKEQLALSMPMLKLPLSESELIQEVDYRGYAGTAGIQPIKKIFSTILDVPEELIYVGGTMSTTIMYDIVNKAVLWGINGHRAWHTYEKVKFICPSPGYEKHFKICESFGIEMIPVDMNEFGPEMDEVERLVAEDEAVKGMWCVPLYSNPTGAVYSDEVIERIASMPTKADDFTVFWDNAYCVHHLTEEKIRIRNIVELCAEHCNPDRVFEFASTSKITFPGGGVAVCVSSKSNIEWLTKTSLLQLKSGDKINQMRHVLFLKDVDGVYSHMKKHRDIIKPKFDLIDKIFHEELDEWNIAKWINPKGGYFINLELQDNMADAVWQMCKEAGVSITPAGSTFPYGRDTHDKFLRLAPTYPSLDELDTAMHLLCVAIKLVYLNKRGEYDEKDCR